jgi:rhamnogalacturonan endolyase
MATYAPGPNSPSPGEMRFITYTNPTVLTNIPAPSNNNGSTGAIESSDIFGHADGTTTSKYYGEYRAIDTQTYGVTGTGVGLFMNIGNRETSSGGPFYKDIDFQNNELYTYTFSGHSQTENFRPGLKGFYALQATTGATPAAPDYTFIDTLGVGGHISGYVGSSGRGTLTGAAGGVPGTLQATVALSNAADQYWATPNAGTGAYTITGVMPGTYTETLYQGELAVGTQTVTITAGQTTAANITNTLYTPSAANTVFRIGTWDGTPLGFLNADKITYMHPTDTRMSAWADSTGMTNFTVGTDSDSSWPLAEWHAAASAAPYVDTTNRITFTLTAAQAATAQTLRIGLTRLDSGRPTVSANSGLWNSSVPALTTQPNSRGLTTGNWRGNNCVYSFNIPTSGLKVGANTIDIYCTSGSTGTLYAGYQIYDAIDLVATSSITNAPHVAIIAVTPAAATLNAFQTQTFTAVARDQFNNVIPANLTWSATRGIIDGVGNYTAPRTAGSDTVAASVGSIIGSAAVNVLATVVDRQVFYNNSSYDGLNAGADANDKNAIATDKVALLPNQTATAANYTNSARGINGIIIDIANLPGASLTTSDFTFTVGTTATPANWAAAPAPASITVFPGAGVGGSDRVEIIWADATIVNQWLQVTVKANAATTGLAMADVFYFGNLVGDTGNAPNGATLAVVSIADILNIKANNGLPQSITSWYDLNRDGLTSISDILNTKANNGQSLTMLTAPPLPPQAGGAVQTATRSTVAVLGATAIPFTAAAIVDTSDSISADLLSRDAPILGKSKSLLA